jgi:hypothetical protein
MQDPRELIERVEALIRLMMEVAAGRETIRNKEREYVAAWRDINGDVRRVPGDQRIRHPNKFASLYDWKEVYDTIDGHPKMYAYLRNLYRPMIRELEAAPTPEMVKAKRREQTAPPERPRQRLTYNELQQKAADDHIERQFEELETPRGVNIVTDVQPLPRKPSAARRAAGYLYEHYIKAIVIGVAVTLLTLLILAALGLDSPV